jgi:hypothetical protein
METQMIVAVVLIISVEAAILFPLIHYLMSGWDIKRKDIVDGMGENACLVYFKMFCRNGNAPSPNDACNQFTDLYHTDYGRPKYLIPSILLFTISIISVTLVVFSALKTLNYVTNPFFDLPITAIAGITGAYMWAVNDLISRSRRLDLAPSDIQSCVLRLIIAVPMGYAFSSIAAKDVGPFIAFALGAFPFSTLSSTLQRITSKSLNIEPQGNEVSDDIVKLQGVDRAIVDRLANEDIRTITQVAYCDPVHITMRSNLSFNFVTDCMNQALAWMYLQDDLDKLRPLGLRGAVEIKHFVEEFDCVGTEPNELLDHDNAVAALPKIAAALNQDPTTVQLVFRNIAEDPYTAFLYEIWT